MKAKKFSDAMNEVDQKYVEEALKHKRKTARPVWIRWGAMAACLCLVVLGSVTLIKNSNLFPTPGGSEITNPVRDVRSVEEIEKSIGFKMARLNKEAERYSVINEDGEPSIGIIYYADGSELRAKKGTGDISGIFGGEIESTGAIDGVSVTYYRYTDLGEDVSYAIWEQGKLTFSYIYTDNGAAEVQEIIQQYK